VLSAAGGFWQHAWVARYALLNGLAYTIELSLIVIVIGTAIGALGGVCLKYGALPLRLLVRAYVDVLRGIPVLVSGASCRPGSTPRSRWSRPRPCSR
jgi:ABC-type amino acid transport system permease subunit